MRIYRKANGDRAEQNAVRFPYQNNAPARYRVFPNYRYEVGGSRKNTLQEEVAFDCIRHAAEFLVRHPDSAIRVWDGKNSRIVFRDIVIDIQAEEPQQAEEVPNEDDQEVTE